MSMEHRSSYREKLFKKFFQSDLISTSNLENTSRFLSQNCRNAESFLNFLYNDDFRPVVNFTKQFHLEDKRKVTGDPYMKHLVYSAYLGYVSPEFKNYSPYKRIIFIAANLMHDTIEMVRKTYPEYMEKDFYTELVDNGFRPDQARKIVVLVSLLTPLPKEVGQPPDKWLAQKFTNFQSITGTKAEDVKVVDNKIFSSMTRLNDYDYEILAEMAKEIKMTDEAANVRETVDDITHEIDGKNVRVNGIKPLSLRYKDFMNRFIIVNPNHLLRNQLKKDLDFIGQYLNSMGQLI